MKVNGEDSHLLFVICHNRFAPSKLGHLSFFLCLLPDVATSLHTPDSLLSKICSGEPEVCYSQSTLSLLLS